MDDPDPDSSRSLSRRDVIRIFSATGVLAGLVPVSRSAELDETKVDGGVIYSCRVIALETGKSVEGAEIVVERSIRGSAPPTPAWVGETTTKTDAEGRFRLEFPPDHVAEPRLCIAMRIRHHGYVPRKAYRARLADILRWQARGEEPFFTTITLERGLEYTGQVVVPGGKPAAGISYWFETWARGNNPVSRFLADDSNGQTDDDGRIRIRMPKTWALAIYLGPPRTPRARLPYAPYQHFWGTDTPSEHPDVWAPTDLGRITLSRGIRLPGRMVGTEGRPIGGQTITAYALRGRLQHSTATEADGTFSLGPLRPGNYLIYGEGQDLYSGGLWADAPPVHGPIRVVRPVRVYLQEDVTPKPLVLREMPTVRVELRFVDSRGKPARGGVARLSGLIPNEGRPADALGAQMDVSGGRASTINDPEPRDTVNRDNWSVQDKPDSEGHLLFLAPKGLREASLSALSFDETIAYKSRLEPDGPLRSGGGGELGVLEADRQVTVVCYRAPTVLVTVKVEEGQVPDDVQVNAGFTVNGGGQGGSLERQPDGRYRTRSLMPDHEYEISAWGTRGTYVPTRIHRINLPEGGSADLTLTVRKRPAPPEVGRRAPGFSVRTLEGRTLSLAGLRDKTVVLHFWQPRLGIPDATSLKAVHDRFGNDSRLAMIGVCLSDDSEAATRVIRSLGLSWPQAALRDRGADPIVIDYGARYPYKAFLIGPDGKLIAKDLEGAALEKAVAQALTGK
jgi:hypothetical protein